MGIVNDTPKGFLIKTATVSGKRRGYVAYVPPAYDPGTPMPGILFLHGMGQCGADGLKHVSTALGSAVMQDVSKWPFIIVFPQKRRVEVEWDDEEPLITAVLGATAGEYNMDRSRMYLTGLSQGGHGTWHFGAKFADMFAAIAPVCGYADEAAAVKLAEAKMPVWAFHGDADSTVLPARSYDMQQWIVAAGGACKLTIYPGIGHNSWDKAYKEENLADWFLAHSK